MTTFTHLNFEIIVYDEAMVGFDPLQQRGTMGWKAHHDGEYYGAWIELQKEPFDHQLKLFAESILGFLANPDRYRCRDGVTPCSLTGDIKPTALTPKPGIEEASEL